MPVLMHFAVERPGEATCTVTSSAQELTVMHEGSLQVPRLYPNHSINLGRIKPSFFLNQSITDSKNDPSKLLLEPQPVVMHT